MRKKIISAFSIIALVFGTVGFNPGVAVAAQYTGVKDTLSTVATNATATHVITHTLVGGDTFAAGETLTYDFVDADFTLNNISNWATSDFSFNDGSARTITAVSTSSGVAPTCTAGTSNVAITINTSTNNFVVTACSTYTASGSNANITFTINGTAGGGTMTNKSSDTDGTSGSKYTITGSNGDSASGAVTAETNGVVTVTANVDPTLTFSNTQSAVDFGTLTSGAARYATAGAASGGSTSASTNAHALTVGTNATSGYTVTYNAPATLTSGSNTIAPSGSTITTSGGTPGTAEFAVGVASASGSPSIQSGYDAASNNYKTVYGTPQSLFVATSPASSDSVNVRYIANIPASQPAGSYSATFTYVATANF